MDLWSRKWPLYQLSHYQTFSKHKLCNYHIPEWCEHFRKISATGYEPATERSQGESSTSIALPRAKCNLMQINVFVFFLDASKAAEERLSLLRFLNLRWETFYNRFFSSLKFLAKQQTSLESSKTDLNIQRNLRLNETTTAVHFYSTQKQKNRTKFLKQLSKQGAGAIAPWYFVVFSAPAIMQPLVQSPSTPSTLFSFCINWKGRK